MACTRWHPPLGAMHKGDECHAQRGDAVQTRTPDHSNVSPIRTHQASGEVDDKYNAGTVTLEDIFAGDPIWCIVSNYCQVRPPLCLHFSLTNYPCKIAQGAMGLAERILR